MPSYQEWVRKIDINIDYYSAFIKSWIAFNSWYRSEYTERTDRGIIEKLKTENNRFKGYIETMLDENNNSDEAIIFKKNLKDLQAALVNAAIVTQERDGINQQISFSEIAINNPKRVAEGDYRVTHYKVQRTNEKISTLRRLTSSYIPGDVQVCISTIQRMYSILKGEELDESAEETSFAEFTTAESKAPKEVVYNRKGGRLGFYDAFGDNYEEILQEMNEELVA